MKCTKAIGKAEEIMCLQFNAEIASSWNYCVEEHTYQAWFRSKDGRKYSCEICYNIEDENPIIGISEMKQLWELDGRGQWVQAS